MARSKKILKQDETLSETLFCTECGEELTDFHLSQLSKDEIRSNYERCKKDGKFNGDRCSKLYIFDDTEEITGDDL